MLTFIMKPVSVLCNLRCDYCYNSNLWSKTKEEKKLKMDIRLLETFICQLSELDENSFSFVWHGGEPLIAGINFYEAAVGFQARYLKGKQYLNSVQTNGTLIDQEWAAFFKKNAFKIGVSLDGPKKIHDQFRKIFNGSGSFERVMKGIEVLKVNGFNPGIISVITKNAAKNVDAIWDFFVSSGLGRLNLSVCAEKENGKMASFSITPLGYASFMIRIFDCWMAKDDPDIKIQPLESYFQGLIGGRPTICHCANECAAYLALDYNGDLYLCGRFVGIDKFRIGNIMEKTLKSLLCSKKWKSLKGEIQASKKECLSCEWANICNGGCTYYRYINGQLLSSLNYFCSATKKILRHMKSAIMELDHSLSTV
ncbi:MAG: hypothetical protein A2Y98_01200 [Candidatus Portnoybacteria bacterium RBG_19FT_COMBO_36_7]|uniref:Anaerobic sulfatase maturase n=1 Tax=Candidatus Portnoybacteria bacterium RBG_19FT_COMBO_36_7 TaxID=1801992 RepID=A0A1G2F6B8_9BACT|nr:MAG: hypothetical protein A2Y98_01200 [Candidatus Portnoybacteria bacterium RBG_19FT_COMBO_36_7]